MAGKQPDSSADGSKSRGWTKLRGKIMEKDYKFSFKRHHESAGRDADDIDEFLGKTTLSSSDSTDRPSVPKINTASNESPAWATRPEDLQEGKWRPTKPSRHSNLHVTFQDMPPAIIGEGGDEAEDPVSTVRRNDQDPSPQAYMRSSATTFEKTALSRKATTAHHIQEGPRQPDHAPLGQQLPVQPPPPELVYPRQPTLPSLSTPVAQHENSTDHSYSAYAPLQGFQPIADTLLIRPPHSSDTFPGHLNSSLSPTHPQNYLQVSSSANRVQSDMDNTSKSPSSPSAQKMFEMHAAEGMAHRNSIRSLHEDMRAALRGESPASSVSSLETAGQVVADQDGIASAESSRPTSKHSRHSVSPEPTAFSTDGTRPNQPASALDSQKYLSLPASAKGLLPGSTSGDLSKLPQRGPQVMKDTEAAVLQDVAPLPYQPTAAVSNTAAHFPPVPLPPLVLRQPADPPALVASAGMTTGPVAPTPRRPADRQRLQMVNDPQQSLHGSLPGTGAVHESLQHSGRHHATSNIADGSYAPYAIRSAESTRGASKSRNMPSTIPHTGQIDNTTTRLDTQHSMEGNEALSYFAGFANSASSIFDLSSKSDGHSHTVQDWQCCALWWFLKARTGLEGLARETSTRSSGLSESDASALRQCHVDLAKTWWIDQAVLPDQIARLETTALSDEAGKLHESLVISFTSLCASMQKRDILPPRQYGLMQGVDPSIWVNDPFETYPSEWSWVLSGSAFVPGGRTPSISPVRSLPLSDDSQSYCYGRIFGRASAAGGDDEPSTNTFNCALTVLRKRRSPELELTIASQTSTAIVMLRTEDEAGVHWEHARFDHEIHCLRIKLPHKLRLWIYCSPKDYAWLWSCYDNSQKITRSMRPHSDEALLSSFLLSSFQYRDSARPEEFPTECLEGCRVALFERFHSPEDRAHRRTHRGYRLAIMTTDKIIRNVTFLVGTKAPLQYALGNTVPEFRLQLKELERGRSAHLVFQSHEQRDHFRDLVTGIAMKANEQVRYQLPLKNVASGAVVQGVSKAQWPSLRFTALQIIDEADPDDPRQLYSTVDMAENLRVMMFSKEGSVVDRLCDASMEVRIRMEAKHPSNLQVMRPAPREDVTVAVGPGTGGEDSLRHTFDTATSVPSAIAYEFENMHDMHTFESALTGYKVMFDGVASLFTITRRRMYVGKDKNWDAKGPRLQIVEREGRYQVLAFFEDYVVADCLNFEVKRTDTFEQVIGSKSGGNGVHGIKLVDAKFTLPGSNKDDWLKEGAQRDARAKYMTLATEEYAAEHDDILVYFDREEERDKFGDALPAPVTKARKFTLMRRI